MAEKADVERDAARYRWLREAVKLKKVMKKKGIRRARAVCPECGGILHGVLAGKRDHLHVHCDGPCKRAMME